MITLPSLKKLFVAFLLAGLAPGTLLHVYAEGPPNNQAFQSNHQDGQDDGNDGAGEDGQGGDEGDFCPRNEFGLHPTASAPVGSGGQARLVGTGTTATALSVEVRGLADGTYTVSTTSLATGTSTVLGTFVVDSTISTDPETEASVALPPGFDPTDIASVQILDVNNVVLLSGTGECHGGEIGGTEELHQHVLLAPTVDAPVGAKGDAEIEASDDNGTSAAFLKVEVNGLLAGTYTVSVTSLSTGTTTVLGTLDASGTNQVDCDSETGLAFPAGFNPLDIAGVQIADLNGVLLLAGDFSTVAPISFKAKVATQAGAAAPGSKGTASIIEHSVRNRITVQHFSLIASKVPASTTLTVKVNGVRTGTVKSNHSGHVTLQKLPKGTLGHKITSVILQEPAGKVVLGAHF